MIGSEQSASFHEEDEWEAGKLGLGNGKGRGDKEMGAASK